MPWGSADKKKGGATNSNESITENCGLRVISAMFNAKTTKSAFRPSLKAQPTTLRLYTLMTIAKYKNPVQVGMLVISAPAIAD